MVPRLFREARGARKVVVLLSGLVCACLVASCTAPLRAPSANHAAGTVFVVVLENRSFDEAMSSSYLRSLATRYALATDYHAVAHPSAPNYLALTSGSTWGVTDDAYHPLPAGGLGNQLDAAHVSWKAYAQGFTGDCFSSPYPYALKHNPFAYYGASCPPNVVSMDRLSTDLAGTAPRLAWLMPDMCNDGHDCSASTVDSWLSSVVPQIVSSRAWSDHGLLAITFDEDNTSGDNRVATVMVSRDLKSHSSGVAYDHYSLLATIEDRLGVGRLGAAGSAHAMNDLVGP
jgi:phospholipase C